jgi:hypothetical protein
MMIQEELKKAIEEFEKKRIAWNAASDKALMEERLDDELRFRAKAITIDYAIERLRTLIE